MKLKYRLFAIGLGLICHATFAAAVASMAYGLYFGLTRSPFPVGGSLGRVVNWGLIIQFPLVHSALLTGKGSTALAHILPPAIGRDLITTTFALIASLQLLAVFLLWTPEHYLLFETHGPLRLFWNTTYGCTWVLLIKSLHDAGLAVQTGYLGWSAVSAGRRVKYSGFPTKGLFQYCRQPVYLSFALVLVAGPVWSVDHILIASVWGLYCFFGPMLKESRYLVRYGSKFDAYRQRVPFFLPTFPVNSSATAAFPSGEQEQL